MSWDDWIQQHATLYGLDDERDLAHLGELASLFGGTGWTPEELIAASRWVALHEPPKFRDAMMRALTARVRSERQRQAGSVPPPSDVDAQHACRLCDWTGWARVPWPKDRYVHGRLVAVLACCSCVAGRRLLRAGDPRPDIEWWYLHMPDWRDWIEAWDRRVAAELAAQVEAENLDRERGPLAMPRVFAEVIQRAQGGRDE